MDEYDTLLQHIKLNIYVVINKIKETKITKELEIQLRRELIVLQQQWLVINEMLVNKMIDAKRRTELQIKELSNI